MAGLYDGDRLVSQSAGESLRQVFDSQVKIRLLWKTYQKSIVEFWSNVIINERPETLIDARGNTVAEMEAKYARTVSGGIMAIGHLISKFSRIHDLAYMISISQK